MTDGKQVYGIVDTVADELVGGLMVFTHDAPVIRIFTDGLADPQTLLNKHPGDFALVCFGEFEGGTLVGGPPREVLSGKQWQDMQNADALRKV